MQLEGAATAGKVMVHDGIGLLRRGDLVLICYQAAARLERTRWLYDVVDGISARSPDGILGLMVVLPTSAPPDAPTRALNNQRMSALGTSVRRLVTTPIGDAIWLSLVRAVMRGLNIALGHSSTRFVASTLDEGITLTLAAASAKTPAHEQIITDLSSLYRALGLPAPDIARAAGIGTA